jgi:ABC-2 type transport system ATP-binding protein
MARNTKEPAIRVRHVSKDFVLPHERITSVKAKFTKVFTRRNRAVETQHALKNISFEIEQGEFFGIVGRNGSGKSTLLKMLAGIYQPTKGKIGVRGKLVPFIELGVGFNPELTGRENVYLNGALLGFSEDEVDEFFDEVVEFAELEQFMDKKLKNYSSGMQVRLAFSMAIRADADILLIDEVLAVGDADFQRKCFNYFNLLKKEKATVVFVSHDMDAVRKYCDRAILIEKGIVAEGGTAEEIAQAYSKQFTEADHSVEQTPEDESERWGNGDAKIANIKLKVSADSVDIIHQVKVIRRVEGLIVGIRVRDSAGTHILGTNTKLERVEIGAQKLGGLLTIAWSFPNILSDGDYVVDPAILLSDEITVADWWDSAATFSVKKLRKVPYPTDPNYTVKLI